MANQLVEYKNFKFGDLDETMIQTIHETIAKDCTEPQFRLFMTIAKSLGANPLLNDIYPTVYQGKLTPQFGVGFYVNQARKHNDYAGYDAQTVHGNDTFNMHQERAEDGRYSAVIDEHKWGFPRGKLLGGYAFAYRTGFKPFSIIMDVAEIEQFLNSPIGMQKTMWTKNTIDMIKKHMAKRALNAAFGLGFEEEQSNESGAAGGTYERKEVNPEAEPVEEKPNPPKKKSDPKNVIDAETTPVIPIDEAAERKVVNALIKAKLKELNITTDDAIGAYMKEHMKVAGDAPTLAERKDLLTFIENAIAAKTDDLPD